MSLIIRALIPSWSLHPRDPIESQWPPKVPISEYHHVGGKNFNLWMSKDTNIQFSLYVLCWHLVSPDSPLSSKGS